MLTVDVCQVDDECRLFISPAIQEWTPLQSYKIDTVIDLEGGLDHCIPTMPGECLYVYFPILDEQLPPLAKLHGIAKLGASLVRDGHVVLSHCGMGFNRSALMAGLILVELGIPGPQAVAQLRERRAGALYNEMFAAFLEAIESQRVEA